MTRLRCWFVIPVAVVVLSLPVDRLLARADGPIATTGQSPQGGPDRAARFARIFEAMALAPGSVVADVGAGQGEYSFRMADLVGPSGRVYAVDISPRALEQLSALVAYRRITNVEVIEGAVDDPRLPAAALDAVLIVNAYHEMAEYPSMLQAILAALKPEGRLVIVDQVTDERRDLPRRLQASRHEIAPGFVREELLAAGFREVTFEGQLSSHEGDTHREFLVVASPDHGGLAPGRAAGRP
jgi:precorrin-6B methylase 2